MAPPSIREDLGASFADLQWGIDAYALSLAALVQAAGSLADRLGRRRFFAAGLAIFFVASLLCALAPESDAPQSGACPPGRGRRGDVRCVAQPPIGQRRLAGEITQHG